MLTIATVTNFKNPELLKRTVQSVSDALIPGVTHRIFDGSSSYILAQYAARMCDQYVAIVDDDDTITTDSIRVMMNAIANFPGRGVYCSDEKRVDIKGKPVLDAARIERTYDAISRSPRNVHHMAVTNSAFIDEQVISLHNEFGFGGCWVFKAAAALSGGMIHIPRTLYNWADTPNSLSKMDAYKYQTQLPIMSNRIRKLWGTRNDSIPKFEPKE